MATTSIWKVEGWLGKVINYAENPEKTEKSDFSENELQGLRDVMDYTMQDYKTERQFYVTAINCRKETARNEMNDIKALYGKDGGIVAFHGYQAFAPGEVDADTAHEIGVKLAKKLWGERFQIIVATHLDKGHLHNHFVLNSVSFIDGYRYYNKKSTYALMRKMSDQLCIEYRLSVINNPVYGKSKQYGEWRAEQENHTTWRGLVKSDVDTAIRQSMTERQFWDNLRKMGYEIKTGKDISVRPPGKERFVRLVRNFGEDYRIEGIRRRILAQTRPERQIIPPDLPPKKVRFIGHIHTARRMTGLRALYFYYLYRMGVFPKKREPSPKRAYFLFREDIRHMQNISRETRLLVKHGIDTDEQLAAHKDGLTTQINELFGTRKHLHNQSRSMKSENALAAIKTEIAALSEKIGELRREVRLCEDVEKRSVEMQDKLHKAKEDEKSKEKEEKSHEPFRRRR